MIDPRIAAALAKLDHGTWSLTVGGFARKALRMSAPLSHKDRATARAAMMATGLPYRRITAGIPTEVWDFNAP